MKKEVCEPSQQVILLEHVLAKSLLVVVAVAGIHHPVMRVLGSLPRSMVVGFVVLPQSTRHGVDLLTIFRRNRGAPFAHFGQQVRNAVIVSFRSAEVADKVEHVCHFRTKKKWKNNK